MHLFPETKVAGECLKLLQLIFETAASHRIENYVIDCNEFMSEKLNT